MVASAIRARPALAQEIAKMVPMGRLGRAEEVADLAAWLLSDRAEFIAGATVPIDGGQTS
jgi:NAD(P)-dependent dehydrogenase (short-subunit alcohol dehydrogenase family)